MTKAYFVVPPNELGQEIDYDYKNEIDEIKKINPDKIFCMIEGETQGDYIFSFFLQNIEDYLKETKKEVVLVVSNPNNLRITDYVVTSTSCGFALLNHFFINDVKENNLIFDWNNCEKAFTSYNNNDKFHRYVLIDKLCKYNLVEQGYVTFTNPKKNILFDDYQIKHYNLEVLKDEEDFVLNAPGRPEFSPMALPKSYLKGFVDIVTESNYTKETYFVTEKTAKPIATLKPFICVANQYYHKHLQEFYDLELYTELFDYSFDEKENLEERVEGVIQNIKKISELFNNSPENLRVTYNALLPKLYRNRDKLKNIIYNKEKMIPNRLKFLLDGSAEIYGTPNSITFNLIKHNGWIEI